jgi:hypothetical protein
MPLDPEALYMQLGRLVEAMPNLNLAQYSSPVQQWLGRAGALISEVGDAADIALFKTAVSSINHIGMRTKAGQDIAILVHRALAVAELRAPVSGALCKSRTPMIL